LSKPPINIVWFKRDLRLNDHEPLMLAASQNIPFFLVYCFEPSLINQPDSDIRHWRFCYQSLKQLNQNLSGFNTKINIFYEEFPQVLTLLLNHFKVQQLYSHIEHGNIASYQRDKAVASICNQHKVLWHQSQCFGVIRGAKNRNNWFKQWHDFMESPLVQPKLTQLKNKAVSLPKSIKLRGEPSIPESLKMHIDLFQPGGEDYAIRYLKSFLNQRIDGYQKGISKPVLSRKTCSRLSPYLAYGCISLRTVYQLTLLAKNSRKGQGRNFNAFLSRLQWHCHFVQKFEMETRMQHENFNKAFDALDRIFKPEWHERFCTGKTGYPMVDANVRCLIATGYINFRMRAMLVAFYTFNLWMPWQPLSIFLAKNFLDYEPGIHYPQIQMQAGTTGVHILRMYNVITQAEKHDVNNEFILKWIPELKVLPPELVQKPWEITPMEEQLYNFNLGVNYPEPIVDIEKTTANTRNKFAQILNSKACLAENKRILKKHVRLKQKEQEMMK
jgi:deoxyribodipyrimidine photo-lyase